MNTIIEKIRAEIERRIKSWSTRGENSPEGQGKDTCVSRVTELTDLLSFLDTLQEQPVKLDKEIKETFDKDITTLKSFGAYSRFARHFYELGRQSKPKVCEGLEEEISRYLREDCSDDDEPSISEVARHFAQWGAEHARDEMMKEAEKPCHTVEEWMEHIKNADQLTKDIFSKGPYDVLYDALNHPYRDCYDAIKEFGELCYQTARQDMMKEAVEGEVLDLGINYLDLGLFDAEKLGLVKDGKVKLIIVKED